MEQSTQLLVIGGGPGGSTAATFLAREGFSVTLIERAVFPRYHIGESLLPSCLEVLDLMGAREKVDRHGFQCKEGGFFAWGKDSWELDFRKMYQAYNRVFWRASMSADTAVNGVYVKTRPHPGLAKVEEKATESAQTA